MTSPRPAGRPTRQGALERVYAWLRTFFFPRSAVRLKKGSDQPSPGARLVSGAVAKRAGLASEGDSTRLAADRGLAALARALDNPDPAMRARAVAVLGELSDVRAREVLKTMLLDPSAMVRCAAVRSAARVGTTEVVASLIVALTDPDAEVRAAAAEGLSAMTGRGLSCAGPERTVDPGELEDLKRWWREKRFAELVGSVEP